MNVETTMSKGDFAAFIRVSPGRVSQYISEGKLFGLAIDGEGRRARIVTEVAMAQLQRTLEPSQRFGANGSAQLAVAAAASQPDEQANAPKPTEATEKVANPLIDALAEERLKQQRLKTARDQREEDLSVGRYMLAADARREAGRAVTEAFKVMDQAIQRMAKMLAAEHGVVERDAVLLLHKAMRETRAEAAAKFREVAETVPEHVEDAGE